MNLPIDDGPLAISRDRPMTRTSRQQLGSKAVARSFWRSLKQSIALTFAGCALAQPAIAHPHVRISVEVIFVVENGVIDHLKHRWTFDRDFRRSNFEEYDTNRNGVLEPDELAPFQKLALETLKRFDSFTVAWRGPVKVPLKEPVLVNFDMQSARPTYEFTVALGSPMPLTDAGTIFDVYDPTYFSAFDIPSPQAVSIEARNSVCSAALISPDRDSAQMKDYRAFASAFGPFAAKSVTPRSIKLTCQPAELPPGPTEGRGEASK